MYPPILVHVLWVTVRACKRWVLVNTKPPEMSGGHPLLLSAPQIVGGIEVQLRQASSGRPLPVSSPRTVDGIQVQLYKTSGGHPLPVSAPQTVGGIELQHRETNGGCPSSKLSIHFQTLSSGGCPEVTVAITVLWIAHLRAIIANQPASNSLMTYSPAKQLFQAGSEGGCFDFLI